jgi:3',5'-nucleoside bisphosphate phosphatase
MLDKMALSITDQIMNKSICVGDPKGDFHLHTVFSDGNWSPGQLVERAIELELSAIAITDHDTVQAIVPATACAKSRITIIPGVEINCHWQASVTSDVHILGYWIELSNTELKKVLEHQAESRAALVDATIAFFFSQSGATLTLDRIQKFAGPGVIMRSHLSLAIAEALQTDLCEVYYKYMHPSGAHYIPRAPTSPQDAIRAIRAAGGLSSLAHPGHPDRLPRGLLAACLEAGLQAIEAYHPLHDDETTLACCRHARREGLLLTGGSDCHGPWKDYPGAIGTQALPVDVVNALLNWPSRA